MHEKFSSVHTEGIELRLKAVWMKKSRRSCGEQKNSKEGDTAEQLHVVGQGLQLLNKLSMHVKYASLTAVQMNVIRI